MSSAIRIVLCLIPVVQIHVYDLHVVHHDFQQGALSLDGHVIPFACLLDRVLTGGQAIIHSAAVMGTDRVFAEGIVYLKLNA